MDTNKFNGMNYNDWLRNLRIVLDFENQGYVLDNPLPTVLPEGSSPKNVTFEKWLEDNRKIMRYIKEVYTVPDRHIRYAAIKAFLGTKMIEGEASTSKTKGKRGGRWKRKKGKGKTIITTASCKGALTTAKGKGKGIFVIEVNMIANTASWVLDTGCGAHIYNDLQVLEKSRKLSKDEIILRLGGGKVIAAEAVGSLSLVISDHIQIELKDCYYVLVDSSRDATVERSGWKEKPNPVGHVFLEKGFPADSQRDEVLLEESSETPQQNGATYFEPLGAADGVPILRRSTRESRPPEIEVTTFKARLVAKGYTQRPGVDFEETYSLIAMAKSIQVLLAIAVWYGIKLSKKQSSKTDEDLKRMSDIPYASAIGRIQYVVQCTRPDVTYALSVTSRYQACAEEAH
ncbi:UNVERIFIED_CONTAM: hypothetical protein Sangu_3158300 [Sesamum angustifolium]|uniref:Reverse transcriptase Ty1/copia-type domain-containing protein n=1 Tax=Sesamum angustifolium TaxID=2727405 RepID=A0AAW2JU67_9LAMI